MHYGFSAVKYWIVPGFFYPFRRHLTLIIIVLGGMAFFDPDIQYWENILVQVKVTHVPQIGWHFIIAWNLTTVHNLLKCQDLMGLASLMPLHMLLWTGILQCTNIPVYHPTLNMKKWTKPNRTDTAVFCGLEQFSLFGICHEPHSRDNQEVGAAKEIQNQPQLSQTMIG